MIKLIEFSGLPGAGKTTLYERVLKYIVESYDGISVVEKDDLYRPPRKPRYYPLICGSLRPARMLRKTFFADRNRYLLDIDEAARLYQTPVPFQSRLIRMLDGLRWLDKHGGENTLVFLDEGLVQHLSSLSYEEGLSLTGATQRLAYEALNTSRPGIVDGCIPIETVMKRIGERNRAVRYDRYNLPDKEKGKKLLEIKRRNIETIISVYGGPVYHMDMEGSPERIADMLISKLTPLLDEWFGSRKRIQP